MTDPNKPTTVVTQPAAGGQQVVMSVLPHGTKPVSVAEVAAADPKSANALLQATRMLDPLMGIVGGGANPAMTAMQSAIAHRGAEAAVETPQMPTTSKARFRVALLSRAVKEHGKMTFVDAPKQHATAQFEAPAAPLAKTASAGAAKEPAEVPKASAGDVHPKQQAAPADAGNDGDSAAHNGSGQKRKHPELSGAGKDQDLVPTAGDKAVPSPDAAAVAPAEATAKPAGTAPTAHTATALCDGCSAHCCHAMNADVRVPAPLPDPAPSRSRAAGEEGESAAKSTRP